MAHRLHRTRPLMLDGVTRSAKLCTDRPRLAIDDTASTLMLHSLALLEAAERSQSPDIVVPPRRFIFIMDSPPNSHVALLETEAHFSVSIVENEIKNCHLTVICEIFHRRRNRECKSSVYEGRNIVARDY